MNQEETDRRTVLLVPAGYRRTPWKNGGGVTIDIAAAWKPGAAEGDWSGMLWRFGRTAIVTPGPFSDLSGYDRAQVVVAGRGLALATPTGEIDVREPFQPVRFAGETQITSRLEDGPVEVVNLIGDRASVAIDVRVLRSGDVVELIPAIHILYAPAGVARIAIDAATHALPDDYALRLEPDHPLQVRAIEGVLLVGSIRSRASA